MTTLAAAALVVACGASAGAAAAAPPEVQTAAEIDAAQSPPELAPTPPMGWNSWNTFGCGVDEEVIRETADAMVETGMRDSGYTYVNIDDCWMAPERDADGNLQADPERFPGGIHALADYVHERGLKLGIYSSAGTMTCQDLPASLGHEEQDARQFAEWEVDLLKYDNCHNEDLPAVPRYTAMADAIAESGRDILLSICEWGANDPWLWAADLAQMWRTTHDIRPSWDSVMTILDQQVGLEEYSGPNAWYDPEMLEVGNVGLTHEESRAHMSLWALMNAPLFAGNDLTSMSEETSALLLDPDVLAIDQDWGGIQGHRIADHGDHEVWAKPMSDGGVAIVLLNRSPRADTLSTSAEELGLEGARAYRMTDVWSDEVSQTRGDVEASVPGHGARMFLLENSRPSAEAPNLTLSVATGDRGVATPDEVFAADVTVSNHGFASVRDLDLDLGVPHGWEVVPADDAPLVLRPGASWTGSFEVRAPIETSAATYDLETRLSYHGAGRDAREQTGIGGVTISSAPRGENYLSDLRPLRANVGWRSGFGVDQSNDGNPITIGGTVYDRGLATHAPAQVDYYLGGQCGHLVGDVGIDDEVGDKGAVTFTVLGDGEVLEETGVVTGADPALPLSVDVADVDILTLAVGPGPDGSNSNDHATWADVRVECSGPVATLTASPERTLTVSAGESVDLAGQLEMSEGEGYDVSIGTYPPSGWEVTGEPSSVDQLPAGQSLTGEWTVTSDPEAEPGQVVEVPVVAGFHDEDGVIAIERDTVRVMVLPEGWADAREAEDPGNVIAGEARVRDCERCSDGGKVGYLGDGEQSTLTVPSLTVPEAGEYSLVIDYLVNGTRDLAISVNGGEPMTISVSGTSFWDSESVEVPVVLEAGENTIEFGNVDGYAPDLDRIGVRQE